MKRSNHDSVARRKNYMNQYKNQNAMTGIEHNYRGQRNRSERKKREKKKKTKGSNNANKSKAKSPRPSNNNSSPIPTPHLTQIHLCQLLTTPSNQEKDRALLTPASSTTGGDLRLLNINSASLIARTRKRSGDIGRPVQPVRRSARKPAGAPA